jgi:hypothetical protein
VVTVGTHGFEVADGEAARDTPVFDRRRSE